MSAAAYARAQKHLDEENSVVRRSASSRGKKRQPLFVASNLDQALARPLSPGLQYAAEIANFDELSERHIWDLPPENRSMITQAQVDAIFRAKCRDQQCAVSFNRAQRFNELIYEKCQGEWCSLRQCGLGMESLKAIVDMLLNDHNITHLDLSGNTFGSDGGEHFARLLAANSTLVVLRLQSINIGEGVSPMMNALEQNKTLTALDLSGIAGITRNTIWGVSALSVASMLEKNQVLASLNLAHCGLQRSTASIAKACVSHVALTKLNLSGNKIKDEGCRAIGELLHRGTCSLLSLSLEENGITCHGASILGEALRAQESPASSSLEQLYLGNNSIGANGVSSLAIAFKEHHKIQVISLAKNKLCNMGVDEDGYRLPDSIDGVGAVFFAVETSRSITSLKLSDCGLDSLPNTIVAALHRTTSLKRLELSENSFGDAGGALLAEGLAKNRSLTFLDCMQCQMASSMAALASALATHKSLTHLRINQGCWDVHESGMIDALKQNQHVVSVDLGRDAMDYLRGALSRNRQLRVHNATPELEEKQRELADEEKLLQETQEFIVDEIKSREKAMEQLKALRDRAKVQAQQMKEELETMKAAVDAGTVKQDKLQLLAQTAEDDFNAKNRELDNERNRLFKKTETLNQQKTEFMNQIAKLTRQHPHLFPPKDGAAPSAASSTGNQIDFEMQQLQLELRLAQNAAADEKETSEAVQTMLKEVQQSIGALTRPAGAATPATPQKKK